MGKPPIDRNCKIGDNRQFEDFKLTVGCGLQGGLKDDKAANHDRVVKHAAALITRPDERAHYE
jgi:hypothetical protein